LLLLLFLLTHSLLFLPPLPCSASTPMSGLKRYRTAVDEGDKEELFDYFKDVVFEDEEAEDWDSKEGKERLSAIVKIVRHVAEMEGRTGQPPEKKKKKLAKEQDSYKAGFLTFCHHYFVAHPGANAQAVRKRWKPEDGEEFPAQQIGDWFNGMRNNIRRRLKVLIALT